MKGALQMRAARAEAQASFEGVLASGAFVAGSPKTVREKLLATIEELGIGNLLTFVQFGTMPHDMTMRNIELLSSEVIPYIKERAGTAVPA